MAVTHVTTLRNIISDNVLSELGNSALMVGRIAADTEAFTLTLPATSGTVGATDLTFGVFTDDTSATGGEVTYLAMETSANAEVFRFLPADVTMSSTTIDPGDTVQCSSLVYTPAA